MKQLFIIGGLLFISVFSNAQWRENNQPDSIRGVLYDKNTNQRLEAAMLTVEAGTKTLSAMTDAEGYFIITGMPATETTLKISMPGYEDRIIVNMKHFDDVEYYIGLDQKKVDHKE